MPKLLMFVFSVGVCLFAGFIGSFFTVSSIPTWYAALNKPSFNPPNWIFGSVWTILYILMGIALYLVIKKGLINNEIKLAATFFAVQLILNTIWSILFFGMRSPLLGFIEIGALWLSILFTTITFWRISSLAGILLIPYILWVSFASVLNYFIWRLN